MEMQGLLTRYARGVFGLAKQPITSFEISRILASSPAPLQKRGVTTTAGSFSILPLLIHQCDHIHHIQPYESNFLPIALNRIELCIKLG